ncbi:hypothetical protein BG006_006494 [Podila minutissima]|uniref:RlpA-like protein double-psi beta-barrel domain-containing protein n=1 Tax=Podila minutissima TaxID=64525 RepID=A0A9P5SUK8_9FUNG|nr:hypothetical protein BG006_006494 [Podila minutissima]
MVKLTFALFAAAVTGTLSMTAPVTRQAESSIFASSNEYSGKATWFTGSYGACNEPVVALSASMMGAQSWGNPACNKRVHITLKSDRSKTVTGSVVDKCPADECDYGSLDLSPPRPRSSAIWIPVRLHL